MKNCAVMSKLNYKINNFLELEILFVTREDVACSYKLLEVTNFSNSSSSLRKTFIQEIRKLCNYFTFQKLYEHLPSYDKNNSKHNMFSDSNKSKVLRKVSYTKYHKKLQKAKLFLTGSKI